MADTIAYSTVPGKLPDLLNKIRESGVPSKANKPWLQSLGFKSSNDPTLLTVLRFIGFVDVSGVPSPAWKEYRGANSKAVLGRAIKLGYESLYATYSNAHVRSNTDLGHVFSTKTDAGKQAIDKMVSTFKNLASIAEFSDEMPSAPTEPSPTAAPTGSSTEPTFTPAAAPVVTTSARSASGLNVNINIELTLPETTDEKVFEAFFKAMRKHLLTDESA